MQRWVQQATIVAALAATAGCGPSSNAPEPDWFVRAWFQWDECFEDDPEFCQLPYVTTLTVAEDGSATLDRERVCNIEAPTDLVWGEEDERAVVLESSEPGAPFHWDVSTPQQVLFSYEGECKAKAELVEDPAAGDSETKWHAGEVGFQRFSPTDCIGTVVSTTEDPCVKDFPKGFPSP